MKCIYIRIKERDDAMKDKLLMESINNALDTVFGTYDTDIIRRLLELDHSSTDTNRLYEIIYEKLCEKKFDGDTDIEMARSFFKDSSQSLNKNM